MTTFRTALSFSLVVVVLLMIGILAVEFGSDSSKTFYHGDQPETSPGSVPLVRQTIGRKFLQVGSFGNKALGSSSASVSGHLSCLSNDCRVRRSMHVSQHEAFAESDRLVPSGPDPLHHRIRIHN